MDKRSDVQIIKAVQDGDIPAFEVLVRRYQRGLRSFVYKIVRDEQAAMDVVQDTFISVYKHISEVDRGRKFSTYLFAIAKNAAISYLRKHAKLISLETGEQQLEEIDFIEQFFRKERIAGVRSAVKSLPKKFSQVLMLYYFHDLSYEEIARTLRTPINTVRTNLRRAKQSLRTKLSYEAH